MKTTCKFFSSLKFLFALYSCMDYHNIASLVSYPFPKAGGAKNRVRTHGLIQGHRGRNDLYLFLRIWLSKDVLKLILQTFWLKQRNDCLRYPGVTNKSRNSAKLHVLMIQNTFNNYKIS